MAGDELTASSRLADARARAAECAARADEAEREASHSRNFARDAAKRSEDAERARKASEVAEQLATAALESARDTADEAQAVARAQRRRNSLAGYSLKGDPVIPYFSTGKKKQLPLLATGWSTITFPLLLSTFWRRYMYRKVFVDLQKDKFFVISDRARYTKRFFGTKILDFLAKTR